MKKIYAIGCVIGFTAFWTFAFIALGETFGDRSVHPMNFVLAVAGLGLGILSWFQIMRASPAMHRRRAAARQHMEEDYQQSLG